MLNSESCDLGRHGLQGMLSGRIDALRRTASGSTGSADEQLREVSQDFAAVMYSVLVKEMQKTVQVGLDEAEGAFANGARDFMGMFLPRAIAGNPDDALARSIYQSLSSQQGERVDEEA